MGVEERGILYSSSGDIEIGATLRKARQDSGATLEDVEYETKIRKRYLAALEREDYADLPSAVYARGFLKTYANYLGLEGEELSQELKDRWDAVQERQRREAAPKEGRFDRRPLVGAATGGIPARRPRISFVAVLGFVFALILLAAAVGGLYWVGQSSRSTVSPDSRSAESSGGDAGQQADSSETPENEAPADQATREEPEPPADPQGAVQEPPPPEIVRITVTVEQEPAWLNVQTDGNLVYEQIAQPGFSQTFEAGQQLAVWSGNAGAVRLEINDQDYGPLGAPGEVRRRVFTLKPAEG